MVSRLIKPKTNGSARRLCTSWIDRFVEFTDNLESPVIFRKWIAISTIAAALEQKVWITTSDRLYPNLYTVLVAHPGVGKTRTIMRGRAFLSELEGLHLSPTDVSTASLVDSLLAAKRTHIQHHPHHIMEEFHTMNILMDEWGVLLKSYEGDIIPILTTFYDVVVPFEQWRRGKDLRIRIPRPQLNILAGSTPSNIIRFIPDFAWDQGFTSRLIMVYSDERARGDDFAERVNDLPNDMRHDLKTIFSLYGEFEVDHSFREAVNKWRANDESPRPTHPKLLHYNSRRRAHIYKLAIVSAVDRGDNLRLDARDFSIARGWLEEAEKAMPDIFTTGGLSVDSRVMDEIEEFVRRQGKPVTEHRILRFASDKLAAHSIIKVLHIMVASQRLVREGDDPITYVAGLPQNLGRA